MKVICELIGGSRLYGLDTPDSDVDTRGVFLNTSHADILGLSRHEIFKREESDLLMFELRHFLRHLARTNTQVIEILFADDFSLITPEFEMLQANRSRLMDSGRLFDSLRGYIHNERRLANGERVGNLGSKRRTHVERYGFSPKNFSHLLRLARCGAVFFRTSVYPVNLKAHDMGFRDLLFSIKTEPEKWDRDRLNEMADKSEKELEDAFRSRKENLSFDFDFANDVCLDFYRPFLC